MTPCFFDDPAHLPGAGGTWLRGEGPKPPDAIWIPQSTAPAQGPSRVAAGLVGALGLTTLAGMLPSPLQAAAIGGAAWLWLWLLFAAVRPLARARSSKNGNPGMLLYPDHLLYWNGSTCAVLNRTEITGLELRVRSIQGARPAFILRGRTGRGALPAPKPGTRVHLQLERWLKDSDRNTSRPSDGPPLERRSAAACEPVSMAARSETGPFMEPAAAAP